MGGAEILSATPNALNALRGREMAMIFQSPRTALNPIRKVGQQIEDVLREHANIPARELKKEAVAALARVRIPDPERRAEAYPFELSGGMCQRVMIAMALACSPSVLIADEPTTGLDVTTQAVIMDLIRDMSRGGNMSTLLITHDLGLAGEYCDRIAVMHAGHVVEAGPTEAILTHSAHPYTRQLLAATPTPETRMDDLVAIPGSLPDLRRSLPVCRFSARCEHRQPICDEPPLPWAAMRPGARRALQVSAMSDGDAARGDEARQVLSGEGRRARARGSMPSMRWTLSSEPAKALASSASRVAANPRWCACLLGSSIRPAERSHSPGATSPTSPRRALSAALTALASRSCSRIRPRASIHPSASSVRSPIRCERLLGLRDASGHRCARSARV